jgi:integral membrane protein (TIGR01906 family)
LKNLGNAARVIFILALPALLVSAAIAFEFNSLWLYKDGFEKYDVSQTTGLSEVELERAAIGLVSYFNSAEEPIRLMVEKDGQPFELFNQREVAHLRDVKQLVRLDYRLLLGTALYVGAYAGACLWWRKKYRRRLAGAVIVGSSIALGMIIVLGVGSTIQGFDQMFTQFHFLAFTNELWMLDPTKDYLMMLFPEAFWYDASMLFGGIVAGVAGTLCGVAGSYLWITKRRAKSQQAI